MKTQPSAFATLIRITVLSACTCGSLFAGQAIADVGAHCEFGPFVTETDPAGLKVRQAPDSSSKINGTLPPMFASKSLDGYLAKVEVRVLAGRDGWFLISGVQDNPALTGISQRRMFRGKGWVSGRKIGVQSQASKDYARPNVKSKVVFTFTDGSSFFGDQMVETGKLTACAGKWGQLEYDEIKLTEESGGSMLIDAAARAGLVSGRFRAWVNQLCDLQETSCSGLGDETDRPR